MNIDTTSSDTTIVIDSCTSSYSHNGNASDNDSASSNDNDNNNNLLLQHMGLSSSNQDARTASADWNLVKQTLLANPKQAKYPHSNGISFPLNLALQNSTSPCPSPIIDLFCKSFPRAITEDTLSNVCRYEHSTGDIMQVLFKYKPCFKDDIKRWDMDYIATNKNKDLACMLITQRVDKCMPSSIKEWDTLRSEVHSFWLENLLTVGSVVVSFNRVLHLQLLEYWILKGNFEACSLLLEQYPSLIANEYPTNPITTDYRDHSASRRTMTDEHEHEQEHDDNNDAHDEEHDASLRSVRPRSNGSDLPIHTAFKSQSDGYSPWNNRSIIVDLLLRKGIEYSGSTTHTPTIEAVSAVASASASASAASAARSIGTATTQRVPQEREQIFNMRKTCGGLYIKDKNNMNVLEHALKLLNDDIHCNDEERKLCLKVCLQYAHAFMFVDLDMNDRDGNDNDYSDNDSDDNNNRTNGSDNDVNMDANPSIPSILEQMKRHLDLKMPILHAAIGIVSVERIQQIIQKFNINITNEFIYYNNDDDSQQLEQKQKHTHTHQVHTYNNFDGRSQHDQCLQNYHHPEPPRIGKNVLFTLLVLFAAPTKPRNGITFCKQSLEREVENARARRSNGLIDFLPRPGGNGNNGGDLNIDEARRDRDRHRRRRQLRRAEILRLGLERDNIRYGDINIPGNGDGGVDNNNENNEEEEEEERLREVESEYLKELLRILLVNETKTIPPKHRGSLRGLPSLHNTSECQSIYPIQYSHMPKYNPAGRMRSSDSSPTSVTINCAQIKDNDGRLPLHFAVESGITLADGLGELIDANMSALLEPDGTTGFYPFALARNDVNLCFSLLLQNPAVMENITKEIID